MPRLLKYILLTVFFLILLLLGGGLLFLYTQSTALLTTLRVAIEERTGAPLVWQENPKFSLFPQPTVQIGAASWGEKTDPVYLSFQNAQAFISMTSLLQGEIHLQSLEIDGLEFFFRAAPLQVNSPENPNPDPLTKTTNSPNYTQADPDAATAWAAFARHVPNNFTLREASFTYSQPDGNNFCLTDLQLELKDFGVKKATFILLEANYQHPGMQAPIPLRLSGMGDLVEVNSWVFANFTFKTPSLTAKASGTMEGGGQNIFGINPHATHIPLTMDMEMEIAGSLHNFFGELALKLPLPPHFFQNKALDNLQLRANISLDPTSITLKNFSGTVDGNTLRTEKNLRLRFSPLTLSGDLHVGEINLSHYMPGTTMAQIPVKNTTRQSPSSPESAQVLVLHSLWPHLDLNLKIDRVIFKQITVENISAKAEGNLGSYTLNPFIFHIWGGAVTSIVDLNLASTPPLVSLRASAPAVNLENLSALLFQNKIFGGSGMCNFSVSFDPGHVAASFSGTGSISALPLTMAAPVFPPDSPYAALFPENADLKTYDHAILTFKAQQGLVQIEDFTLTSRYLTAKTSGRLSLPSQNMDIQGLILVPTAMPIPVRIYGPFDNVRYDVGHTLEIRAEEP